MTPLSDAELMAEAGTALPDKEVASILDLNADLDLGINAAAPIDLAIAANANVAAPIDAAASANILSFGSDAQALSDQGVIINQGIDADATAASAQDSTIDQETGSTDGTDTGATDVTAEESALPTDVNSALNSNLLNVNVDLDAAADIAAPINGAVAANANVAAPIDAAVAANIGSIDSNAFAVSQQDAIINQNITGEATATADQQSDLRQ
ncbi:peptidoglycan-binding protein [Arthrobacter sp. NicSoilB4]|uniref:peptidoglycan-binding protein n=1 Tax=Arthrobacter sp. NicSoilB4 TaxID=2830997 RepID=UPI001CC6E22A|nr:peptidoglycan-binding protein [Arthrobacter sp. NicSoilB4]